MNNPSAVNRPFPKGPVLKQALLEKLRAILREVGWLSILPSTSPASHHAPDAAIRLASDTNSQEELQVYIKDRMRPGSFSTWANTRVRDGHERRGIPILAMPVVSARLAELCRRESWSWVDLAGNCWIDVPGQLHIHRTGNRSAYSPHPRSANLSTAATARVMRVLLSPAHAGRAWTQRAIQQSTCWQLRNDRPVSLGLVNKVIRHLRNEGFIDSADKCGVRVSDPIGLLEAWSAAYRFDRHERLSYFTLMKHDQLAKALNATGRDAGGLAAYAAFSAADFQAPHVRQPKTWVYVAAEFMTSLTEHAQARLVDSGENLVVLIPGDPGVFLSFDAENGSGMSALGCTDPVQTYVDLRQCGSRGEEAAQALLEQRLLPAWREKGQHDD